MPDAPPASYLDAHRYDGAVIQHDRRDGIFVCTIQPRDLALIADVRRHKFLTAPQLLELWWPGRSARAGQRRLRRLFRAGHLERFRPIARRGSFPWTYHLGEYGHRLLQQAGLVERRVRYRRRAIYDYSLVLHELQLNGWALACRRLLGDRLLRWEGETDIEPPAEARQGQGRLDDYWTVEGLRTPQPRLLRPDTTLELIVADNEPGEPATILVEFDRTRRLDKNYDKFRRYDAFLNDWWRHTVLGERQEPPMVLFVCQDDEQRERFLRGADHQLTGHRWHPSATPDEHEHVGRRRILFAIEADAHRGRLEAWRLPAFPPGHPARDNTVQRVAIGGRPRAAAHKGQLRLPEAA
jgi:hypothetical protein